MTEAEEKPESVEMTVGLNEGKVIIHFGKKAVAWVELDKDQAMKIAEIIIEKANLLRPVS